MWGGPRRTLRLCACAASLAILGGLAISAEPAGARSGATRVTGYAPTGSLTFSWQAEPSRGCATDGLCGVVGSITMRFGQYSTGSSQPNPPVDLQDGDAVARSVLVTSSGQSQEACAYAENVDMQVSIVGTGSRRRALELGDNQFAPLPSAGTCAGPTQQDLTHFVLPVRSLGRRGYEIAGSDSFGAGPFEVTVQARVRAAFASVGRGPPPPVGVTLPKTRRRSRLQETASVSYRLQSEQGSLGASFSGAPNPLCASAGTCGAQGSVSLALTGHGGQLTFVGDRLVRRRVGERAAVRDLEDGRLSIGANELNPAVSVTGTLQAPDGFDCNDDEPEAGAAPIEAVVHRRSIALDFAGPLRFVGADPLRTRCPGPSGSDIAGSGALGSARVSLSALDSPTITLRLSGAGSFSGDGYVGTRDGAMVLMFKRVGQSGGTHRIEQVQVVGR